MSFKERQEQVDKIVSQYGGYWDPAYIVMQMYEETTEIGRIIARVYGDKPAKEGEELKDLGGELSDALYAILCLANREEIDLDEEWEKKLVERTERDKDRFKKKDQTSKP
ncbi:MAG: pyrophosphatase [Nanoarchaeota archaeon]|nr:pyrophosphatase [Nanoarchaeota archaeon]|tara:strand:+ start:1793 stop:2122 length:330 start_codon:yes stop_codon:yes gene_type:complete